MSDMSVAGETIADIDLPSVEGIAHAAPPTAIARWMKKNPASRAAWRRSLIIVRT
jgi:hypothetical protein